MNNSVPSWPDPPSYAMIVAAVGGSPDAVNLVVEHYSGYIAALATRQGRSASGELTPYVDHELCKRMETKLILAIMAFDLS